MLTASGFSSCGSARAPVLGRSTGTPTTRSGAVTMKMMSSTSITSTKGVMLISAMGWRLAPLARGGWIVAAISGLPVIQAAGEDGRELVHEGLQPVGVAVHVGGELVVGDD